MRKSVDQALISASEAVELIKQKLPDLTMEDKVDLAARLGAVAKHCKAIDDAVKGDIAKQCKGDTGIVKGNLFQAIRKWCDKTVFSVTKFKEAEPKLYDHYKEDGGNYQVTFGPR